MAKSKVDRGRSHIRKIAGSFADKKLGSEVPAGLDEVEVEILDRDIDDFTGYTRRCCVLPRMSNEMKSVLSSFQKMKVGSSRDSLNNIPEAVDELLPEHKTWSPTARTSRLSSSHSQGSNLDSNVQSMDYQGSYVDDKDVDVFWAYQAETPTNTPSVRKKSPASSMSVQDPRRSCRKKEITNKASNSVNKGSSPAHVYKCTQKTQRLLNRSSDLQGRINNLKQKVSKIGRHPNLTVSRSFDYNYDITDEAFKSDLATAMDVGMLPSAQRRSNWQNGAEPMQVDKGMRRRSYTFS